MTPDLFSDNPVTDSIEMANPWGGVVKSTAQAGVMIAVSLQPLTH
jgi:hypothetical protein